MGMFWIKVDTRGIAQVYPNLQLFYAWSVGLKDIRSRNPSIPAQSHYPIYPIINKSFLLDDFIGLITVQIAPICNLIILTTGENV